jgi:hypothetical protein
MHDKMMTKSGVTPRKKGKPFLRIKHGSAVVPIYKARTRWFATPTLAILASLPAVPRFILEAGFVYAST